MDDLDASLHIMQTSELKIVFKKNETLKNENEKHFRLKSFLIKIGLIQQETATILNI